MFGRNTSPLKTFHYVKLSIMKKTFHFAVENFPYVA